MKLDKGSSALLLLVSGSIVAAFAAVVYQSQDAVAALLPVLVGGVLIAVGLKALAEIDDRNADGPTSK